MTSNSGAGPLRFSASQAYNADASQVISGGVNSNVRLAGFPMPLCFERGEGAHLYDIDGNRFIDYVLGMGPTILGHAPRAVCDAVAKSLSNGQMLGGQHKAELELARKLTACIPSAELVRIGMTGSEVVQAALRVARAFTGRRKFIKFEGQYHGWFDNVLISHRPPASERANDIPRQPQLETAGQVSSVTTDIVVLPWNDIDAVRQVVATIGGEIAAIITEPVMCNTGVILPRAGYLEALRELATEHGIVLIFDEVITGFRLAVGGAQEHFGITPDLSTFAKAMASGFPISALVGCADIMSLFAEGRVNHSGTYNASLPSIFAAMATLDAIAANDGFILSDIERRGQQLIEGIRKIARDNRSDLKVQGYGACFNIFFSDDDHIWDCVAYSRTNLQKQRQLLTELVSSGIRPTSRSTWFVSAAHTGADVDETLEAVARAMRLLAK